MLDVLAVFGFLALYGVAWLAAEFWTRSRFRKYAAEIMLLPAKQRDALVEELFRQEPPSSSRPNPWMGELIARTLPIVAAIALPAFFAVILALGLPSWTVVFVALVVLLPLIRVGAYYSQRRRMRQTARRRLAELGVPVCLDCGHDLRGGVRPDRCPGCGAGIPWESLAARPEPPDAGEPAPPADTRPRKRRSPWVLVPLLALPLVMTLPIPFVSRMIQRVGKENREAWRVVDVPADTILEVGRGDVYGFFVRADCRADVASGADAEVPAGGLRLQLLNAETGEPVELQAPSRRRRGRRWDVQGTSVRMVRRVALSDPGRYRLVVDGDPTSGPVYWRPRLLRAHLHLLAWLAAPLVVGLLVAGAAAGGKRGLFRRDYRLKDRAALDADDATLAWAVVEPLWSLRGGWRCRFVTRGQRWAHAVTALQREVLSGGFAQYFWNPAADRYADARAGLEAFALPPYSELLKEAGDRLGPGGPDLRRVARQRQLDALSAQRRDEYLKWWTENTDPPEPPETAEIHAVNVLNVCVFEPLNDRFYDLHGDGDAFYAAMAKHIRQHPDEFFR